MPGVDPATPSAAGRSVGPAGPVPRPAAAARLDLSGVPSDEGQSGEMPARRGMAATGGSLTQAFARAGRAHPASGRIGVAAELGGRIRAAMLAGKRAPVVISSNGGGVSTPPGPNARRPHAPHRNGHRSNRAQLIEHGLIDRGLIEHGLIKRGPIEHRRAGLALVARVRGDRLLGEIRLPVARAMLPASRAVLQPTVGRGAARSPGGRGAAGAARVPGKRAVIPTQPIVTPGAARSAPITSQPAAPVRAGSVVICGSPPMPTRASSTPRCARSCVR